MRIIGYAYEAAMHCVACAKDRFGEDERYGWVPDSAVDDEGNNVHPVFSTDEIEPGEACDDCGEELA